ncbi:MAG: formylglycine-generating enzyme family protein [Lewinellaceae bacterium]|nr:formylglycine-generating enzyme family protein [Lewinellaceae bacterium]
MEAVNRQTPNETPTQTDKKTDETPAVSTDMTTNEPPAPSSKPVGAEPAKEDTKDLPDIPKFVMVPVEGGTFTMGQPDPNISCEGCSSDECPHEVTVRSFEIGKYEVTQKQWRQVMGDNPSSFKNCDDCPVEKVSWDDVQRFLDALNARLPRGQKKYRLPTEAEWEFAARGGKGSRRYTYAGANDPGKVAWYYDNSGSKTHPVGQLAPNELGIHDMSGNVYEWCDDTWGPYPCDTKTKKESSRRVVRGGSHGLR